VEISSFEFRLDQVEIPFSFLVLVRSRTIVASLLRFLRFPVGLTARVNFTPRSSGGTTVTSRGATGFFERTCVPLSENNFS
jgi:hypothetical protein